MKNLLDDIERLAVRNNAELGITGALFAYDGRFLQVIEGPRDAVRQIYGAISTCGRHTDLRVIENRPAATRLFDCWTMCCGLFEADCEGLAREPALKDGFHPETLSPSEALGLLGLVRDLQALPPRDRRRGEGECVLAAECLDRNCAQWTATAA